jgi:undecaprenyl-diphosphatase
VALHAGTLVALAGRARVRPFVVAATVPPALAGLLLEGVVERAGPRVIAIGLLVGSAALVLADRAPEDRVEPTTADGLWLGLAQAFALVPGISRAGATRSAARALGFTRGASVRLSAELAVPVLLGATVLKSVRLAQRRPSRSVLVALAAGAGASFVSSAAVLRLERRVTMPASAWAAYRCALAAVVLRMRHNRMR